jgi:integrase
MMNPETHSSNGWQGRSVPVKVAHNINIRNKRSRAALEPDTNPYYVTIRRGLSLGYRKNETKAGTWSFRRYAEGRYEYFVPDAVADDELKANSENVLSYEQAENAAQKWNDGQQLIEASGIVSGAYTVKDAVEDYLKDKETEKRKPLYRDRVTAKAHIYPTLGSVQLRKLTHGRVRAWHLALAEPEKAPRTRTKKGKQQATRKGFNPGNPNALQARQSTANRVLTVLKAALNHAKSQTRRIGTDAAWVDVKPFRNADRKKDRFLSLDEVKHFIPACEPEFAKLVKGALYTGARYSELTRLKVTNFNESDSNVFIEKSKSGEARHVYLNSDAFAFFKSITQNREPKELIFLKAGRAWRQSEQKRPMDEACKTAEIEGVTFHTLRHTYASLAREAGMPLDVLKDQLGHADLRMTMRYAKIGMTHQQTQVQQFAPTYSF